MVVTVNPSPLAVVGTGMPTTHVNRRRSAAFDDLLTQITGELALTPASATWANAPFLDVDPDPEGVAEEPAIATGNSRFSDEQHPDLVKWIAASSAAVLIALLAFGAGQFSAHAEPVAALEHIETTELHKPSSVMVVAPGTNTVIPAAPRAPSAKNAVSEALSQAEPKRPKPRTRRRPRPKPKSQPKPVAFEDL